MRPLYLMRKLRLREVGPVLQVPQVAPNQKCLHNRTPPLAGPTDSYRLVTHLSSLTNSQTYPLSGGSWGSHGYGNEDNQGE